MIRKHKNRVRGVRGSKPRTSSGNGDHSEADAQYLLGRNRQIFAKAEMAELELRARRGDWIEKKVASWQASILLGAFKTRVLQEPNSLVRRLISAGFIEAKLRLNVEMMIKDDLDSMLEELSCLPEKVVADLNEIDDDNYVHIDVENDERAPTGEIKAERVERRRKKMRQARRAREKRA